MNKWRVTLDYPQVWFAGFVALIWLISYLLPSGVDMLVTPGWLLLVAGMALMIWAPLYFHRAHTTINPHGQPAQLITGGPYRWSRNPIYLADMIVLIGLCLALHALPGLLLIPVFRFIITRRFIHTEEARLAAAFPVAYEAYASRVHRWL